MQGIFYIYQMSGEFKLINKFLFRSSTENSNNKSNAWNVNLNNGNTNNNNKSNNNNVRCVRGEQISCL